MRHFSLSSEKRPIGSSSDEVLRCQRPLGNVVMAGRRGSETGIDEILIGRLLEEQAPRLAGLRAVKVRDGWDNAVWRLGDSLAIRITRRAVAAGLHQHEQRWLPVLAPGLPLPVPVPVI